MKRFSVMFLAIFAALLVSGSVFVSAGSESSLLAKWDIVISAPGQDLPGTFKLEKDGESFKGAVNTEMGEVPLKNIKINDENSFTADITANVQGQTMEGTMNGKVTDGNLSGEINLAGLGSIPYSGKKAQ